MLSEPQGRGGREACGWQARLAGAAGGRGWRARLAGPCPMLTDPAVPRRHACSPALEHISKLPYLRAVLSESLRLYPQPPILIRRCERPSRAADQLEAGSAGPPAASDPPARQLPDPAPPRCAPSVGHCVMTCCRADWAATRRATQWGRAPTSSSPSGTCTGEQPLTWELSSSHVGAAAAALCCQPQLRAPGCLPQVSLPVGRTGCLPAGALLRAPREPRLQGGLGRVQPRTAGQRALPQRGHIRLCVHPLWCVGRALGERAHGAGLPLWVGASDGWRLAPGAAGVLLLAVPAGRRAPPPAPSPSTQPPLPRRASSVPSRPFCTPSSSLLSMTSWSLP